MRLFPVLFRPLFIALGLLTRIPVPRQEPLSDQSLGDSVLAYPWVGLLIGVVLAGMANLPIAWETDLRSALILTVWVGITGGLHLDGLADSADAWVGGMGDRQRTLEIMRDPHSGPMAILILTLLLLVKFAAIKALLLADQGMLLILPPILGRCGILLLFLTLPYVRVQGMGAVAAQRVPKKKALFLLLLIGGGLPYLYGEIGFKLVLFFLGGFLLLRRQMYRRLGGTTGDSTGALCELLEAVALLSMV